MQLQIRPKHKRHLSVEHEGTLEKKKHTEVKTESPKRMSSIGEDQVDLAQTYTGLDKKISEEFISIAMDPERKSKASSSHGSEIGTTKTCWSHVHITKLYHSTPYQCKKFAHIYRA